jgi:hypothetical protein
MNIQHTLARSQRWLAPVLAIAAFAVACDRPSQVLSPSNEISRQAAVTGMTTVQFNVTRADNGAPVPGATVSVYLTSTDAPTWLTTDGAGTAQIDLPTGSRIGYLARLLPPEWTNLAGGVMPPLDPGTFTTPLYSDLSALVCARNNASVEFTPGRFSQCVSNLFLTLRGPTETVNLPLPVTNSRSVTVKDLNGNTVSSGVHAYLIEALQAPMPWQTLPAGVKAGFLRYYGPAPSNLPGAAGYIEVYGSSPDGFEIAGTQLVTAGTTGATVETSPVICANDVDNVLYSVSVPPKNQPFSFTEAKWAYGAVRGATAALDKDLTTTVVVLEFSQTSGTATIDVSQRMRTANGTLTASASVQCTAGVCNVAGAILSAPGSSNPLVPHLYQPKAGKLFWVVNGVEPTADSEWSAKGTSGNVVDQIPNPSKKNASSAFAPFSKAFIFCDPDKSFDGGWGCSI